MLYAAGLSLAIWLYLIFARGGFWLALERERGAPAPAAWPEVVAVIPARDEAETIAATVGSLLAQDYPGAFRVVRRRRRERATARPRSRARRRAPTVVAGTADPARLVRQAVGGARRGSRRRARPRPICC